MAHAMCSSSRESEHTCTSSAPDPALGLQIVVAVVDLVDSVVAGEDGGQLPAFMATQNLCSWPTKCLQTLRGHDGAVLRVCFNVDGKYCVSAGQDKTVRLWNPFSKLLVKTYSGHGAEVLDVKASVDNSKLYSGGGDRLVFVWDVSTGRVLRRLRGHAQRVNAVAQSPQETVLATGSYDATVHLWDLKTRSVEPIDVLEQATDSVTSVVVDDPVIVTGSVDGGIRQYDVRKGMVTVDHLGSPVGCVSLSHDRRGILAGTLANRNVATDNQRQATGGQCGRIMLLDRENGSVLSTYSGHTNDSYRMDSQLNADDAFVLGGSEDGRVYVWDLVDGRIVKALAGHTGAVAGLSCHPKDNFVVTGAHDGTIRLWG